MGYSVCSLDYLADLLPLCSCADMYYEDLLKFGWREDIFKRIERDWRDSLKDNQLDILPIVTNPLYYEKVNIYCI